MDRTHQVIARIAGCILLLFGAGMVALAVLAAEPILRSRGAADAPLRIVVALCAGLGTPLCVIGFRLAANRPNRHGSILSPAGWYVLVFLCAALAATFVVLALLQMQSEFVTGALLAALFGWWCWTAAGRTRAGGNAAGGEGDNPLGAAVGSRRGYVRLMTVRGIPVFAHVSIPSGGLMFAAYAGFDFRNSLYYCIGYVLLIGAHEAGHALAATLLDIKVTSVDISGAGGVCWSEPPRKVSHAAILFSAGILVQILILIAALACGYLVGTPTSRLGRSLFTSFTSINAILLVWNLLPIQPGGLATDGKMLWQLLRQVVRHQRYPFEQYIAVPPGEAPVLPRDTQLLTMPALVPKDFKQGIEILNDSSTPMELVVRCLTLHLGLESEAAITTMLAIHNNGGALLALPSKQRALEVAAAITAEAQQHGHALVCRAVEATADSS